MQINSSQDAAGELATSYSKLELDYIKRLVSHKEQQWQFKQLN